MIIMCRRHNTEDPETGYHPVETSTELADASARLAAAETRLAVERCRHAADFFRRHVDSVKPTYHSMLLLCVEKSMGYQDDYVDYSDYVTCLLHRLEEEIERTDAATAWMKEQQRDEYFDRRARVRTREYALLREK